MKLQLSKMRINELARSTFTRTHATPSDVTGIELGGADARGCPAVRLVRHGDALRIRAVGFIPPPRSKTPQSWDDLKLVKDAWDLPGPFQAPVAAVALTSPAQLVRQTTLEDIQGEFAATSPTSDAPAPILPGTPLARDGIRFTFQPVEGTPLVLLAGFPEYQILWLTRLFPEGRHPTVHSVQAVPFAELAAITAHPDFLSVGGNAFCIHVSRTEIRFAGWHEGRLVLLRECPDVAGWESIRRVVQVELGVEEEMIDELLEANLIDPTLVLEPLLRPFFRDLEFSISYMAHRLGTRPKKIFLLGLPSGGRYWNQLAETQMNVELGVPDLVQPLFAHARKVGVDDLTPAQSQTFLSALGAARASMESPIRTLAPCTPPPLT